MKKFIAVVCIVSATMSIANQGGFDDKRNDRSDSKPPKEAIEVCVDKAIDSKCQVTTRHGDTLNGTCKYTPDEKYFVCEPENPPKRNK
jgi:hypothetical protein